MSLDRRQTLAGALGAVLMPRAAGAAAAPSAAGLHDDALLLRRACEALHPGLLRYNTPADIDARFAALRAALARDASLGAAYLAFSQFAAGVRCGHTYANFHNQPAPLRAALFGALPCVPFEFRWLRGRMIVTRDLGAEARLVPGTEVVSIDGTPCGEILARLMSIARADGSNDAKRVAWLQVQGTEKIEAFDVFLPLLFPRERGSFRLEVRDGREPAAATRTIAVDAIAAAARRVPAGRVPPEANPGWTLTRPDPRIAVLTFPTWALYNGRWDWRAFLRQAFESLASDAVPNLVIDLRGNEGGLDVGRALLAHLVDRDLALPEYRRLVRYRKVPDDLAPFLDTWDPSFKDWGDNAQPFDERFLRLTRDDDSAEGNLIRPAGPRCRSRVFVLIGATNSSATFEFALQVRRAGLGTLVGQPTGGNLRGINGGAFFFLRLPHSTIELDLPLIGQFPREPQPDAGLAPDRLVEPAVHDIVAGRDAELAAVLAGL